jgi:pyruvate formate lyase activating enzyme
MDPEKHRKFTGQTNEAVLDNARRIARISSVTVRVPVIPGFNHSKEEIQAIAEFASTLPGIVGVHLLPYHSLGENKYKMLGMEYKMNRLQAKSLHEEDLEAYRPVIEAFGIKCLIGEKK